MGHVLHRKPRTEAYRTAQQWANSLHRVFDNIDKRRSKSASKSPAELPSNPSLAITLGPYSDLDADAQERRGFYFFCHRTAAEISGYLPSEFWDTLLLQASHTDPAILHAVIALGSLHEIYEEHTSRCLEDGEALDRRRFALQQSNKAISHLGTQLALAPPSGEVILICCLLFICLETFQGDYSAALTHLDSGLRILGSLMHQDRHPALASDLPTYHDRGFVENTLAPLFTQLDLQASTYLNTRTVNYKLIAKDLDAAPPIPEQFTSLTEAQECLNSQLHYMLHYENEAWQRLAEAKDGSDYETPDELMSMFLDAQANHRTLLEKWLMTLNGYLTNYSVKMGSKELRAAVVLKIHHITCKILLEATLFDHETGFDELVDEFGRIVALAETFSKISSSTQRSGTKPSYSFGWGVLPSLYYTAVRCRHPIIRRRALALLSASPRREGVWDSLILASIIRWVIGEEESDLDEVTCAEDVPLSVRIYMVERSLRVAERRCLVKYMKGRRNEYNGLRNKWDEVWVTW
ncbi:Aspercryptin biosynthesis cluster-specific transcription regulator [Hyphodiscus hymeniophilus]|uniref:Aspercryptin biosynthesis cluster-specific transcription regulator n=1 Tax=Hyphodiscus hymeniophilus TaxID=353542 RepID=A0A9P6VGN1_9HELO|nr:Aspercryptin biosynthesis cluster-specific transcription regulator [Hyphodiscus hymeniophilus]